MSKLELAASVLAEIFLPVVASNPRRRLFVSTALTCFSGGGCSRGKFSFVF